MLLFAAGNDVKNAEAVAGTDTLMKVAIMPAILLVIFTVIYFVRKINQLNNWPHS
jgi:hypothetical protein